MVTDARSNTKTWIDSYARNAQLTKDDDSTQVSFAVIYENPPYPLEREFRASSSPVDLLYIIGTPNSSPVLGHNQTTYGYEEHVPITIACIDKTGITGTKLRWKALAELRYVAETYPTGSQLTLEEERPSEEHLGSIIVHSQRVILNYRRSKTN